MLIRVMLLATESARDRPRQPRQLSATTAHPGCIGQSGLVEEQLTARPADCSGFVSKRGHVVLLNGSAA